MSKGFTLIELVVVITVIVFLSGIILFSITQYVSSGKDSNIFSNLSILIPAGEVYYNGNNNSYAGFCSSTVVTDAENQMSQNPSGDCPVNNAGVCCKVKDANDAWVACARKFSDSSRAYCVDSRGIKEEILNSYCTSAGITINSVTQWQCP